MRTTPFTTRRDLLGAGEFIGVTVLLSVLLWMLVVCFSFCLCGGIEHIGSLLTCLYVVFLKHIICFGSLTEPDVKLYAEAHPYHVIESSLSNYSKVGMCTVCSACTMCIMQCSMVGVKCMLKKDRDVICNISRKLIKISNIHTPHQIKSNHTGGIPDK